MTHPPVFMPIRELGRWIRSRKLSPVEVAEFFLDRLESLGPRYNAIVTLTRERALDEARKAEQDIMSGRDKGPLHGIPYGAKDLLATAGGIPTTWGAAPFRRQIFDEDATVIGKLKDTGAVLSAKLAMVELAGGMGYCQPNATFTGPGITPWDLNRWSGGSSSGCGSAVSAGLVPFAIGSETWGSILGPANHCGVTGLRPTYGRISRYGAMTCSWTLDKLGPLCLTADDCGLVLERIAGIDPKDPTTCPHPFKYERPASDRRFRLGMIENVLDGSDAAVCKNFEEAIKALEKAATVETVTLPELPCEEITRIILFAESSSAFEDIVESGKTEELTAPEDHYNPLVRSAILAKDYIRALRLRYIMAREVARVMAPLDALIAPTRPTAATPIDKPFRSVTGGAAKDIMGAVGNGAGLPSISVPNGFTEGGLPTGIQFMGKAYDENTIIAAAHVYQTLTDWHLRYPPDAAV